MKTNCRKQSTAVSAQEPHPPVSEQENGEEICISIVPLYTHIPKALHKAANILAHRDWLAWVVWGLTALTHLVVCRSTMMLRRQRGLACPASNHCSKWGSYLLTFPKHHHCSTLVDGFAHQLLASPLNAYKMHWSKRRRCKNRGFPWARYPGSHIPTECDPCSLLSSVSGAEARGDFTYIWLHKDDLLLYNSDVAHGRLRVLCIWGPGPASAATIQAAAVTVLQGSQLGYKSLTRPRAEKPDWKQFIWTPLHLDSNGIRKVKIEQTQKLCLAAPAVSKHLFTKPSSSLLFPSLTSLSLSPPILPACCFNA